MKIDSPLKKENTFGFERIKSFLNSELFTSEKNKLLNEKTEKIKQNRK